MVLELNGSCIADEKEGAGVELKVVSDFWGSKNEDEVVDKERL